MFKNNRAKKARIIEISKTFAISFDVTIYTFSPALYSYVRGQGIGYGGQGIIPACGLYGCDPYHQRVAGT